MARFAAIGLDHRHIYDLVDGLLQAGQDCAGYCPKTTDPHVLAGVCRLALEAQARATRFTPGARQ